MPKDPKALTDAEAHELKNQYESGFDAATQKSIDKYISNTNFDGKDHSLSQTMNYIANMGIDINTATAAEINAKLGLSLTPTQVKAMQKTSNNLDAAMHPIGKDVQLQRGCHEGDLKRLFGIKNYQSMSESQLQKALVGQEFQNTAVMSTSYKVSANPFLGSGPAAGGRELVYNIKAGANTKMVWGAMHQSEAILAKGTRWKVTGVRFTGKTAFPKAGGAKPQIEIDIETC